MDVQKIHARGFAPDLKSRHEMWAILCRDFFQGHLPGDDRAIEIWAGYCEIINNIRAEQDCTGHESRGAELRRTG